MSNFFVTTYGAIGDGENNDAPAIQAAIDACHAAGGGTVIIPAGRRFRSGSLRLRSFIDLHLEPGSRLEASGLEADYTIRAVTSGLSDGRVEDETLPSLVFIAADDCEDLRITGSGVIDGGGRHFIESAEGPIHRMRKLRPYTVFFRGCRRVAIHDVTVQDGAYWTLRLTGCVDAVVSAITIDNDLLLPNSDGIDIDSCQNVRIRDCQISTGDDAICLKTCQESIEFGACEDILVADCTIQTTSSGLCIGSEIAQPIRRCIFTNCVISASNRGLALKLAEGGGVDSIIFSNIIIESRFFHRAWWGRGEPIYVSASPYRSSGGHARNIRFHNILARSENGVLIRAEERGSIEGLILENVRIELDRWSGLAGGLWDLRPHLTNTGLLDHGTSGFHLERVSDVRMNGCEVLWAQPQTTRATDMRSALTLIDVDGLRLHDFIGDSADAAQWPAIYRERAS